jgi:predicted component of type VI protein secretion system
MSTRFSLRTADGQEHVITGPFRIGRDPECQVQLDNDLVSRIHASIWIDRDHLLLRDERSRNGTQLNGRALAPGEAQYLHHGDEVRVGETVFTVETDPPYPAPSARRGTAEPPATGRVPPSPAPAPNPAAASSPVAAPRRSLAWPLAIGGCVVLALLVACCLLGFLGVTVGGPIISTALAPLLRSAATPGPFPY